MPVRTVSRISDGTTGPAGSPAPTRAHPQHARQHPPPRDQLACDGDGRHQLDRRRQHELVAGRPPRQAQAPPTSRGKRRKSRGTRLCTSSTWTRLGPDTTRSVPDTVDERKGLAAQPGGHASLMTLTLLLLLLLVVLAVAIFGGGWGRTTVIHRRRVVPPPVIRETVYDDRFEEVVVDDAPEPRRPRRVIEY